MMYHLHIFLHCMSFTHFREAGSHVTLMWCMGGPVTDGWTDGLTDRRTDGRKLGRSAMLCLPWLSPVANKKDGAGANGLNYDLLYTGVIR